MTCLRPIQESELALIMEWRMAPEITKYMYTDPVLTLEQQKKWFAAEKERNDRQDFMIEVEGQPCGVLNITDIDGENSRCSWGYYMGVKEKRSLKLAMALEWNLYDYVFDTLQLNKLEGEIFTFNKAVMRIHQMCGSSVEGILKQHIKKNGAYYDVAVISILRAEWQAIKGKYEYERIAFDV